MGQVITIGLDIAKSVFQVHGVDERFEPFYGRCRPRFPLGGAGGWPNESLALLRQTRDGRLGI